MAGLGPPGLPSSDLSSLTFLAGGGEMGERMRALDWSKTPLGDPHTWPQSLRSTLSMLLPSKAQIILFWGPEFVVFYNDAYRPVFGAKHPHVLGATGREAWSEIWDSVLHGLLADVVRTGEAFWGKDLLFTLERHGFPEETYFDVSYDPVRDETGAVGGVFCIVTETTERVIGERRMALLKDLAAGNTTSRTPRDACVLAVQTITANAHDITFAQAYIEDELQCGTADAEAQRAASSPALIRELAIPMSTPGARARLVVGLNPRLPFTDRYRAFLDLVADQLGTALANARAYEEERQRAEALAAIDRAKTAFFSNVSHEFRTPLTLLLGPVQDALATPERTLSADSLATVNRNALRLLKLVNTLLEFSRIEAGRAEAHYEPTDLAVFTTDLAGAFRSAVESAGLEFVVACGPLSGVAHVDRAMWEKIVFNLLSNALKFTFEGRIRLVLQQEGQAVRMTVSDSGVGIPADQLPQVFERFHRVRGSRGRSHEGTGIGLALVQELVHMHGGTIAVDSEAGRGTTFTVTMPMVRPQHAGEPAEAARSLSPASVSADAYVSEALGWVARRDAAPLAASTDPGLARVLLADDNADMRDYVRRLLGERWAVEAVADGAAALASARARRPDIVVADVMMPELDGFELLKALRSEPSTKDVPVVLLSARAGEEATLQGIEAGADDYLVKPFTARDLIARVDAQLRRAQARAAALEYEARLTAASEEQRRQLAEASQIKDEFLATLSHELRTPLNAILGWTHMLQVSPPRPELVERAMQSIERNAKAQAKLVDDLLDVSRVISGKLSIKSEDVSMRAVISDAVDAVRPALNAKALRLRTGIDPDADIVIRGDADRLRQVVWNLLSNAVKFTLPGGSIDIDVKRAGQTLELGIRDSGVGIEAAFLPHVFDRFRQGESSPSRQHGGLGLGLAIVRHLVEAHGGTVAAFSDGPGSGSAFVIHLPLDGARPRLLPAVANKRQAAGVGGLRVLIADDDADARDVLRMLLEAYGNEVVAVASAADALAALTASAFDALIADIGMPSQDGYSLMRAIRDLPAEAGGAIPAIAVTAYASLKERDEALGAGFTAHMGKPFDPDRLIEILAKIANARPVIGSA